MCRRGGAGCERQAPWATDAVRCPVTPPRGGSRARRSSMAGPTGRWCCARGTRAVPTPQQRRCAPTAAGTASARCTVRVCACRAAAQAAGAGRRCLRRAGPPCAWPARRALPRTGRLPRRAVRAACSPQRASPASAMPRRYGCRSRSRSRSCPRPCGLLRRPPASYAACPSVLCCAPAAPRVLSMHWPLPTVVGSMINDA